MFVGYDYQNGMFIYVVSFQFGQFYYVYDEYGWMI